MRNTTHNLDAEIDELLADPQYEDHPLRAALEQLYQRQQDQIGQLERLTSISDGYQSVLNKRYQTLTERHEKQMRQLQKIVKISDHYQQMLQELNDTLRIASTQDTLTGLFNRRFMLDRLQNEAALTKRRNNTFSLLLVDVDHFKKINDNFGHDAGDKALVAIANALTLALRASDVCARWGGEEFLILLLDTNEADSVEIANRLRRAVCTLSFPEVAPDIHITVSIGLAEHRANNSLEAAIKRADVALYAAKAGGRNRVCRASELNELNEHEVQN